MDMFAWTRKEAVLYNGIIICCIGFESILVFLVVKVASQRYDPMSMNRWDRWKYILLKLDNWRHCFLYSRVGDRPVLLVGLAIIFCGFFVLLPWGNHYPKIQWAGMDYFLNPVVEMILYKIFNIKHSFRRWHTDTRMLLFLTCRPEK